MRKIKKLFPNEDLTLFCRSGLGEVFKVLNLVDSYVEINKSKGGWEAAVKLLKENDYDRIITPHESFRTSLIVARLTAKEKIGFTKWWSSWIYDFKIDRPMHWPEALRQLYLLTALDSTLRDQFSLLSLEGTFLNINTAREINEQHTIPDWAIGSVENEVLNLSLDVERFHLPQRFIAVSPGSVWPTKRWIEAGFVEVIQSLHLPVVLMGSVSERDICSRIHEQSPNSINLAGQTSLLEMLKVLSLADLVVSNDSGAQHMGAALNRPVVSLFGPTTLDLGYRPWSQRVGIVEVSLPCRPCGKHGSKVCPLSTHDCMKKISARMVTQKIQEILGLT